MKRILPILILLGIAAGALGVNPYMMVIARKNADGITYLINEGFEGTGTPSGWSTVTGSPDYDSTATVLAGSESLLCASSAGPLVSFDAQGDIWVYAILQQDAGASSPYMLILEAAGGANIVEVRYNATTKAQLTCGGVTVYSAASFWGDNTPYHVWVHYIKGTGANSEAHLYVSTDGTRGAADLSSTGGTATADIAQVYFWPVSANKIVDNVRISADEIGDQ